MKVYLDYTQDELDRQYEHAHIVDNIEFFTERSRTESARVRAAATGRFDVAYGAGKDELLDIYLADADNAPIMVFFHGGRWAVGSKESNCEAAETYCRAGAHFISVNFTLLPGTTMDGLIGQCRDAVAWVHANAGTFGGDGGRIHVVGKSSGAHVAAMMVTTDWQGAYGLPADLIKGGLLVSGMYDLEPVRLTFRNEWTRLDADSAARNSPIHHIPALGCPLVIGYGALESEEFKRQPQTFAAAWRKAGHDCALVEMPEHHHFSLNAEMANPTNPLLEPVLARLGAAKAAA